MNWIQEIFQRLWEEDGQDLVEYALLMVLIALVAVTALNVVGQAIVSIFTKAAASLNAQPGP